MGLTLSQSQKNILTGVGGAITGLCTLVAGVLGILIWQSSKKSMNQMVRGSITKPKSKKLEYGLYISLGFFVVGLAILIVGGIAATDPIMGPLGQMPGNPETVTTPGSEGFGSQPTTVYQNIGFGPLVAKDNIDNWLRGQTPGSPTGFSRWPDGNGQIVEIPSDAFKSMYGFIPPSFQYFPMGQDSNLYSPENYQEGRRRCMQACSLTECNAVQTEVPQNCFHQTLQISQPTGEGGVPTEGEFVNACGSQSSHSCTLFYDTMEKADDAYWTLNNFTSGTSGCLGAGDDGDILVGCLGQKFYEDTSPALPDVSPTQDLLKPSESPVKWCDVTVMKPNFGSMYAGEGCTCGFEENCTDPACCRWRDLATTEAVTNQKPYYHLPVAVEALSESGGPKLVKAVNINENGDRTCCGLCAPSSYFSNFTPPSQTLDALDIIQWNRAQNDANVPEDQKHLVSCYNKKCEHPEEKHCWEVDTFASSVFLPEATRQVLQEVGGFEGTEPDYCIGDPLIQPDALAERPFGTRFREAFIPGEPNWDPLMGSCYTRQNATIGVTTQMNCSADTVQRGCFGSPPIINLSNASGPMGACSNDSIIPQSARCAEFKDSEGNPINPGVCKEFPYACGTQGGSNRLWVPRSSALNFLPTVEEAPSTGETL